MKKFVPVSDAFGNKDPIAHDIARNYADAMCKNAMQKVGAALAAAHHIFGGRLGSMVAPAFTRAARPSRFRFSTSGPALRIDT